MTDVIAPLLLDCYKTDHKRFYPEGTEFVSSNLTARSAKYATVPEEYHENKVVFFGLSYFIQEYLVDYWNKNFFELDVDDVCQKYEDFLLSYLGPNSIGSSHIRALHNLGYLPIRIKALPEGTRVPIQVPMLIVENTVPEFFWVTNYLETMISCSIWKPIVNATTAHSIRSMLDYWCMKTGGDAGFVPLQGHDFSFRGMSGLEDACVSGMAHLTSFVGSDTLPAAEYVDKYYNAYEVCDMTAVSVAATEHAVSSLSIVDIAEQLEQNGQYEDYKLSSYGEYSDIKEVAEYLMMKRYITELYPNGIVSIVGDTFDYFRSLTSIYPKLADEILAREGKVVSRPDSGIPIDIICGTEWDNESADTPEGKGALRILWETFGGETNSNGYKVLHPNVGLIYGDSMNFESCNAILERMEQMGFASTNVVFGIGSWTYNGPITRDSYGMAVKATFGIVNGKPREIYKDPKTGAGKKSAKGLLAVVTNADGELALREQVPYDEYMQDVENDAMETVFLDGKHLVKPDFQEVRDRLS